MKRIVLFVCAVLLTTAMASAQSKVIEKSSKKTPAWIGTAVDDYLVVTVNSPTLAEAQKKIMLEITERIIQSVASNVTVNTQNEISEVNVNGDITSTDDFRQTTKINSAHLPFLKDISLAKVEEIYWEKVQDKKTKKEHYVYSAKYPFSESERKALIAEFERIDAEKVAEYEALEEKIDIIENVEEIKDAIQQLETLEAYFFDEVRLSQVTGLKKRYKELYNTLSVSGTFLASGKYKCQLLLGGSPVKTAVLPKVTSNCASQLNVEHTDDGMFMVTYDAIDCLPEEENFLAINFRIDGKKIGHKAMLKEAGGAGIATFSVVPEGRIIFTADSTVAAERKVYDINVRLTLNNRGGTAFALKSVELQIPEIVSPLVFDDIDAIYSSAGIIQVKMLAKGSFSVREAKKSAFSFVEGSMTLVNPQTGVVERKKLSLPYITNWE